MAIKAARKIQFGIESTKGTEVNATQIWRGTGTIEDRLDLINVPEDIGYISGVGRTIIPKVLGALTFEDTPATFEQLPYILACGVKNTTSGSADGAGTGKIYTYTFHSLATSLNTIKSLTMEFGDDQQEEQMLYSFVDSFKLAGRSGEALNMGAQWLGRQVAPGTFTSPPALATIEDILFSKGKLFIDAVGGTIGTTQKSNTLLAASLNVKTGWIPVFTGDGNLYFSFEKATPPEIVLDITFEHDATSVAEKANWRAQTARLIRLKFEGNALGTPGTTYTYKTLIIDLAGKWEKFSTLDEQDGNDIVTGTFRAQYNSTAAKFAEILVVNEVASL